jgi:hypothetical protein
MFVHGENSTLFLLLPDPDPDPGKDAGDSSGVPRGASFRLCIPLILPKVRLYSMSCVREACFREVVVGGLGGSTLNPADIVGRRGKRHGAYSYTWVGQNIGKSTTRSTLRFRKT